MLTTGYSRGFELATMLLLATLNNMYSQLSKSRKTATTKSYDSQTLQKATVMQSISSKKKKTSSVSIGGNLIPTGLKASTKKGLCPQELFVFNTQTQGCRWDPVSGLLLEHKNKKACRTLSRLSDWLSLGVQMAGVTLNLLHVHRHKESGPWG